MTPKEKAKELIEKYSPLVTTWDCYNDSPTEDEYILRDSKKCAIICVDEILSNAGLGLIMTNWWNKVKQELELL